VLKLKGNEKEKSALQLILHSAFARVKVQRDDREGTVMMGSDVVHAEAVPLVRKAEEKKEMRSINHAIMHLVSPGSTSRKGKKQKLGVVSIECGRLLLEDTEKQRRTPFSRKLLKSQKRKKLTTKSVLLFLLQGKRDGGGEDNGHMRALFIKFRENGWTCSNSRPSGNPRKARSHCGSFRERKEKRESIPLKNNRQPRQGGRDPQERTK